MYDPDKVVNGLNRAKELLQKGWTKTVLEDGLPRDVYYDDLSEFTLDEALARAAFEINGDWEDSLEFQWHLEDSVETYLEFQLGIGPDDEPVCLIEFNDDLGRTQKEIVEVVGNVVKMVQDGAGYTLTYPVELEEDTNDTIFVRAPDFPELTTFGENRDDALSKASKALEEAIDARLYEGKEIPESSAGNIRVKVSTFMTIKVVHYRKVGR